MSRRPTTPDGRDPRRSGADAPVSPSNTRRSPGRSRPSRPKRTRDRPTPTTDADPTESASQALRVSPLESAIRHPFVVAFILAQALVLAALTTLFQPTTYIALSTLSVVDSGVAGASAPLDRATGRNAAFAFSRYGYSTASAKGIERRTGIPAGKAFSQLSFQAGGGTPFITIRSTGASPAEAIRLNQAASETLRGIVNGFKVASEQRLESLRTRYNTARRAAIDASSRRLAAETELSDRRNDALFDPSSTAAAAAVVNAEQATSAATLETELASARSDSLFTLVSDAEQQIENGLRLDVFSDTYFAGSEGGGRPGNTAVLILLAGVLIALALTTALENREQFVRRR